MSAVVRLAREQAIHFHEIQKSLVGDLRTAVPAASLLAAGLLTVAWNAGLGWLAGRVIGIW